MKHYAGLDLSMESTQVCIVDETDRKVAIMKVYSAPDRIRTLVLLSHKAAFLRFERRHRIVLC